MPEQILVVEDDPAIAALIQYNLQHGGYETKVIGDGLQALETAACTKPNLILLDLMLPGLNGQEVCKQLKSWPETSQIPVMILSVLSSESNVLQGFDLGAVDYMTKPFSPRILLARVQNILRRSASKEEPPSIVAYGKLVMDREKHEVRLAGKKVAFSCLEFDLLAFLISRPGRAFSRDQLLKNCWPEGVFVVDRAVDVHINAIRRKLGAMRESIETVWGIGYRAREVEPPAPESGTSEDKAGA